MRVWIEGRWCDVVVRPIFDDNPLWDQIILCSVLMALVTGSPLKIGNKSTSPGP